MPIDPSLITKTEDASKGGFQSIKRITGVLSGVEKVEGKEENAMTDDKGNLVVKDRAKITLTNATILEMAEGEEEPDLTDGSFTFYMNYAKKGAAKAHQNSFYIAAFVKSAQVLAKARGSTTPDLSDLVDTAVVLEYQTVVLFKKRNADTKELEDIEGRNFVFISDDEGTPANLDDIVANELAGCNIASATRKLALNNRTKADPSWKEALNNGTLCGKVGGKLYIDDSGVFQAS